MSTAGPTSRWEEKPRKGIFPTKQSPYNAAVRVIANFFLRVYPCVNSGTIGAFRSWDTCYIISMQFRDGGYRTRAEDDVRLLGMNVR